MVQTHNMIVIHVFLVSLISNLISANNCDPVWRYQPEKIALKQDTIHQNSTACVCSAEYCDDFVVAYPTLQNSFLTVRSSQYEQENETQPARFFQSNGKLENTLPANTKTNYTVKSNKLQKIWGFGGALTDSTAILVAEQPADIQNLILETYFSRDTGNGYSMIRTNMGGCDFSVRNYTYAETPGDFGLVDFELAVEDTEFKIPILKRIYEFAGGSDKVKLYRVVFQESLIQGAVNDRDVLKTQYFGFLLGFFGFFGVFWVFLSVCPHNHDFGVKF